MFVFRAFTISLVCSLAFGTTYFVVKHCEEEPNAAELATINNINVSPYPVKIPSTVNLDGEVTIHHTLDSNKKYDVKLKISKHVLFRYAPIPCFGGVGSCTYDDLCGLLAEKFPTCPSDLIERDLPCQCDQLEAKTYTFQAALELTKELVKTSLMFGDYKIDLKIVEHDSKKVIECVHVEASIEDDDCTGYFCNVLGK